MMEKNYKIVESIGTFDGYIDHAICDRILKDFDLNKNNKKAFTRQDSERVTKKYKDDVSIMYYKGESWIHEMEEVCNAIRESLVVYDKQTGFMDFSEIKDLHFTHMKVQETLPGGGYHVWHVEKNYNEVSSRRVLVYTLYLNDIEYGGETEFLKQKTRVSAKKGRICIFPAGYPYVHRGNPPLQENKYILTSWLNS